MFASDLCALTISSPETTASVPKQRPGYLIRRLPTAVPTRSPAVFFASAAIELRGEFLPAFCIAQFLLG